MNFRALFHVVSLLVLFLGLSMAIPIPFSLFYDDGNVPAFLISMAVCFGAGLPVYLLTREKETDLMIREGFAIVAFGWCAMALFGSLPFVVSGAIPGFTDAFFETMSGFTTTGATILTDVPSISHGLLLWRSFTQWLGGMGIIVLSIAILPFLKVGGMQLYKAEVPGPGKDKLRPRIRDTAKLLWKVYLLFSGLEVILLMLGGMSFFEALCHTFTTMATGGFSTENASIGAFHSPFIEYVVILFMLIAGTNFVLHFRFLTGEGKAYFKDEEFRYYLGIIGAYTAVLFVDTWLTHHGEGEEAFRESLFQTVSMVTTTGFGTADYELWSPLAQMVLFICMFVGGCAGSTGGSIKVVRHLLLLKICRSEIRKVVHPTAILPVRYHRKAVPIEVLTNIMGFFLFYFIMFLAGAAALSLFGIDLKSAFGAVAATLGNVGPGLGTVGPSHNYAHLPLLAKWILSFLMLVGRLEIFTVLVIFTPTFWKE